MSTRANLCPAREAIASPVASLFSAALSLTLLMTLGGCGGDEDTPKSSDASQVADAAQDDATGADVAAADSAADGGAQTSVAWWQCSDWEDLKGSKTPRNSSCEIKFDDGKYGCKSPWYGVKVGGQDYTCNNCGGGDPLTQGKWRAVDFASEDPTVPLKNGRKELLIIDGNTWHLRTGKKGTDGSWWEVKVDGWYWCSDSAELSTGDLGFHITKVEGSPEMGWDPSEIFTGHFLSKGSDKRAWGFFATFSTAEKDWIGYVNYCRVGSTVGGKLCKDPYE